MRAAIIAIGSEMLGIGRTDTNSLDITAVLERYGVALDRKSIVADDRPSIIREMQYLLENHEIVVVTGGLGPTEDDLTREAIAELLGWHLLEDAAIVEQIRERFAARGIRMPEVNRRQARIFEGNVPLANPRGTAPGFHLEFEYAAAKRHLWVFPGVPHELAGMLENHFEPWLQSVGGTRVERKILKIAGLTESQVEERLAPYYSAHRNEPFSILASGGEIQIHLTAANSDQLEARRREIAALFLTELFGADDDTLESAVGRMLVERGETLGIAESCSGGLLSSRITDISGSSTYFLGGIISYTRDAKQFLLGVDPAVIDAQGEVAEEVARQMARGARRRFGSTYGIGITGIAGPTGGTPEKPVGTVHIAVATPSQIEHRKLLLNGSRKMIKRQSTQHALNLLRLTMLK